ncbi:hypothetical protein Cgig2_030396 [Carnegiea gigantea]|uniref:DUF4283 domain-containing protein n=1 Tax=Carnegiea gigantea TaxID=171969 RepID=A0A9Q1KL93_9CARY|nr:hypothetical protein Cgig2_030396 [Carnegiea gigantea]
MPSRGFRCSCSPLGRLLSSTCLIYLPVLACSSSSPHSPILGFSGPYFFQDKQSLWMTALGLEQAWKRLALTAEEEAVVVCDNNVHENRAEQTTLCLWGKLYTDNYFNVVAMKRVFNNVWKPSKGVMIRDLDKNLFAFQFFSDKALVLTDGPCAFDGNILSLKELTRSEQPSTMNFQVNVDVTRTLRRGFRVKLPEFCYRCGKLGHVLKD